MTTAFERMHSCEAIQSMTDIVIDCQDIVRRVRTLAHAELLTIEEADKFEEHLNCAVRLCVGLTLH